METRQKINPETCNECGLCAAICPMEILSVGGSRKDRVVEVRADRSQCCIGCGHCMAICPTQAISVDGLSYEEHFFGLPEGRIDADAFFDLVASRRSVRLFKDTPVPQRRFKGL